MAMTSPAFKSSLRAAAAGFGMHAPEEYPLPQEAPERGLLTLRRRHGDFAAGEDCCLMELRLDDQGVLRWQDGFSRTLFPQADAGVSTARCWTTTNWWTSSSSSA